METEQGVTVGVLARLAGVTVRTLHHYDEIGLVSPEQRSEAGYRLYGHRQVQRLQEVLFFRELGFALDQIREIIGQPSYDRPSALQRQRELIELRADRLLNMIDAIDHAIEIEREGIIMTNEEMLEVFDGFDPSEHEEEAKERWGKTDAYQESARRTSSYSKQDWELNKAENHEINEAFLALMENGTPADSAEARAVAERHRAHITKWFYECTPEIHAGLGQMYVADERFTKNIDQAGEGLAHYMSDAIAALHAK